LLSALDRVFQPLPRDPLLRGLRLFVKLFDFGKERIGAVEQLETGHFFKGHNTPGNDSECCRLNCTSGMRRLLGPLNSCLVISRLSLCRTYLCPTMGSNFPLTARPEHWVSRSVQA